MINVFRAITIPFDLTYTLNVLFGFVNMRSVYGIVRDMQIKTVHIADAVFFLYSKN